LLDLQYVNSFSCKSVESLAWGLLAGTGGAGNQFSRSGFGLKLWAVYNRSIANLEKGMIDFPQTALGKNLVTDSDFGELL